MKSHYQLFASSINHHTIQHFLVSPKSYYSRTDSSASITSTSTIAFDSPSTLILRGTQ